MAPEDTPSFKPSGEERLERDDGFAESDARLEAMVAAHFDAVWRSLRRLGVAEAALDDAAQQVFIVAARKLSTILEGGEKPFLLGVAVRVASDARRTHFRRREVAEEIAPLAIDGTPLPDDLLDRKRARLLLDQILASLPMDLRAAFTMFELEEMSVPEVAAALGIPLGTAASRLRRAREQFHEAVSRLGVTQGVRHG